MQNLPIEYTFKNVYLNRWTMIAAERELERGKARPQRFFIGKIVYSRTQRVDIDCRPFAAGALLDI